MRDRAKELKNAAKSKDAEADLLAKIASMSPKDKALAEGIHKLMKSIAPELEPKTWYGMPAYFKDGKVVCFFQAGEKFKTRYSTFGFQEAAKLDEGAMWATSFALIKLNPETKKTITELVKRAIS